MSKPQPYVIRSNDRVMYVGKTGSGKTVAMKNLVLEPLNRWTFVDVKGEEASNLPVPCLRDMDDVHTALFAEKPDDRLDRFVYQPRKASLEEWDTLCEWHYELGNCHLAADELKSLYHGRGLTEHHNEILTSGRSRGVGCSGNTQRPMRIPREAISESEHIFIFKLKDPDDQDRMSKVTAGQLPIEPVQLGRHEYIYDHDYLDAPVHHKPLDL